MPPLARPVLKKVVVKKPASTWPGLSPRISEVFNSVLRGQIPANLSDVTIKRHKLWHRLLYPAAGSTSLTYMNGTVADFVTNFSNVLPNETAFALGRINVSIETGILTTGLTDAAGRQVAMINGATSNQIALMTEQLRQVCVAGQLKLTVGDKQVVNQKDLTNFPAGHQPNTNGAAVAGAGAANDTFSVIPFQNGTPWDQPWLFRPWFPVLPAKQVTAQIIWQGALAVTSAVTYINVELEGIMVSPSNL